jgi:carbohydrate-selective porin OprB
VQNLNEKWGLFMRANGASGYTTPIKTSIADGGVLNNPLNRDKLDQIGLGIAWGRLPGLRPTRQTSATSG